MMLRNVLSIRYILAAALFFLAIQSVFAAPVQEEAARRAALRFASAFTPLRSEPEELTLVLSGAVHPATTLRSTGQAALYYVYTTGQGKGFVIVSGEDTTYPILGYATEGLFESGQMPDNLTHWLRFYEEEITYAAGVNEEATAEIKQQWADLLSDRAATSITPAVLLSTANWDQSTPYNDLCPTDTTGNKTVTGCVATAMGIAMKYHNWPEKGEGSHSYRTRTDSLLVSTPFNATYDWNNMQDTYSNTAGVAGWNAAQATAVSTLLYHCGVAVEMDYTSSASGAYTQDVPTALEKNFGYDRGMSLIYRELYTAEEWAERIINELDNDRPVLYGGATRDNSGHYFVVDGYATTGDYFHVNWGWSGIANGYYRLSSLQPSSQGIGGSATGAGYSYEQDALTGMRPAQETSYTNNELYFLVYDPRLLGLNIRFKSYGIYTDVNRIVQNEPFKLYHSFIYDYGGREFDGELAVFLEDKDQNIKETLCVIGMEEPLPGGYLFWEQEGMELLIESEVEEGDNIRMYYRPNGYDWRDLRGESGTITQLAVYNETATSTSKAIKEEDLRMEAIGSQLNIHFSSGTEIKQVNAYTLQGQEIASQSYNTTVSPVTMDLSHTDNKILIVTVHTAEGIISRKVATEK